MRRDDDQIWNRVARTVDPLRTARDSRVPTADPRRTRTPTRRPAAPPPPRPGAAGERIVAEGRQRANDGVARPASSPTTEGSDGRFLAALEEWWNGKGRRTDGSVPSASLPAGLAPLGHGPAPAVSAGEPGTIDRPTTRKIARRRLPLEGRIDLHGMDQDRAHGALLAFLRRARAEGLRHVIVITGKGRAGDGVLRRAVPRWLGTEPFRGLVNGTREAARHDGGAGALYVKIRRVR